MLLAACVSSRDTWITGKPEVSFRNQAIAQLCAFHSPFTGLMSEMAIYR
jgi:hypothetical protein